MFVFLMQMIRTLYLGWCENFSVELNLNTETEMFLVSWLWDYNGSILICWDFFYSCVQLTYLYQSTFFVSKMEVHGWKYFAAHSTPRTKTRFVCLYWTWILFNRSFVWAPSITYQETFSCSFSSKPSTRFVENCLHGYRYCVWVYSILSLHSFIIDFNISFA